MPDLWCIRRFGPGPQSFTRRQHHQQKPVGGCLTYKQYPCTGGEPLQQYIQQLGEPQQLSNASGESLVQQQFHEHDTQQLGNASGEPLVQQQFLEHPQLGNASGEPLHRQQHHEHP